MATAAAIHSRTEQGNSFITDLVTEDDLAAYRRDGAICIRGVASPSEVEAMRIAAADVVEARLAKGEAEGRPRPTEPAFHNLLHIWQDSPAFAEILLHSAVPKVARDLMQSRKVIVFGDSLLIKEPGTPSRTPWHHDMPYWPVRGEQVCSIWIALDHVTRANGGMEYVAGSHRWGRMFRPKFFNGTESADTRFETVPDFDADRDAYSFVTWDLAPGDVLVHQGLTVHGAGENGHSDLSRRAYAPRYVGDAAWWEPEFHSSKGNPAAKRLGKGDPVDRYGIHPVAIDLT